MYLGKRHLTPTVNTVHPRSQPSPVVAMATFVSLPPGSTSLLLPACPSPGPRASALVGRTQAPHAHTSSSPASNRSAGFRLDKDSVHPDRGRVSPGSLAVDCSCVLRPYSPLRMFLVGLPLTPVLSFHPPGIWDLGIDWH